MNPELRRNLQIEYSAQRAVAMPVVLGLIFAAAGTVGDAAAVAVTARIAFAVLTVFWAVRRAASVFDSELANNTWDGQRMSTLSALELYVGKLVGGVAYPFYGLGICVVVGFFARLADDGGWSDGIGPGLDVAAVALNSLTDMLTALLAITVSMFFATVLMRRPRATRGISVTLCQVAGIGAAWMVYWSRGWFSDVDVLAMEFLYSRKLIATGWYGLHLDPDLFSIASTLVFIAWAVLGAVRVLREILQFRDRRWAWGAFVLFAGFYVAGFDALYLRLPSEASGTAMFLSILWLVALASTYQAVLFEPKRVRDLRAFAAALDRRDVNGLFEHVPLWIVSLGLTVVLMLIALFYVSAVPVLPRVVSIWFGEFGVGATMRALLILATLFVVRDCLFVVGLNFKSRAGRADVAAVIYLAVLYFVVPLLLSPFVGTASLALSFFVPQPSLSLFASLWPILAEIALVGAWTWGRWRHVRAPVAGVPAAA